ncbi:uncharacterized protein YALI1_B04947g [Yarrowia lipolytica]|uniref:Uncharacterized protein n=1 Tax=Yarrowia lipolytica TaxID=4952 RepID=A0A1D8N6B2_YARLL|nr:hypothetical protein YALI1_B04947g [Yarrowia lipolytica]
MCVCASLSKNAEKQVCVCLCLYLSLCLQYRLYRQVKKRPNKGEGTGRRGFICEDTQSFPLLYAASGWRGQLYLVTLFEWWSALSGLLI